VWSVRTSSATLDNLMADMFSAPSESGNPAMYSVRQSFCAVFDASFSSSSGYGGEIPPSLFQFQHREYLCPSTSLQVSVISRVLSPAPDSNRRYRRQCGFEETHGSGVWTSNLILFGDKRSSPEKRRLSLKRGQLRTEEVRDLVSWSSRNNQS
jgi:hypothetical protein